MICILCKQPLSPRELEAAKAVLKMIDRDLPVVCPFCMVTRDDSELEVEHFHLRRNDENGQ